MNAKFPLGRDQKKGGRAEARRRERQDMTLLDIAGHTQARKEMRAVRAAEHRQRETESWFKNRVARGISAPFAEIVEITPEIAALFLRGNDGNRPAKKPVVDRLVSEIVSGRWELNGETIIIAKDGCLNDGQHRCQAVIASGTPIRSMVMFGADRLSRFTTDQGIVRTTGDMASMVGIENGKVVATVASYIYSYQKKGALFNDRIGAGAKIRPARTQTLELIEAHPEIESVVKRTPTNTPGGRALGAFSRWAIERRVGTVGLASVEEFFVKLTTGENLKGGDPILVARNYLMGKDKRYYANERAQIIFYAWNDFRSGRARSSFRLNKENNAALPELRK